MSSKKRNSINANAVIDVVALPILSLGVLVLFSLLSLGKAELGIQSPMSLALFLATPQLIALTLVFGGICLLTMPIADQRVAFNKSKKTRKQFKFKSIQVAEVMCGCAFIIAGLAYFCSWLGASIAFNWAAIMFIVACIVSLKSRE